MAEAMQDCALNVTNKFFDLHLAEMNSNKTISRGRFDGAKDRYVIGKIDIPILFIAQREKGNAPRANIQTLWDFWSTYFRVRRLTLYDCETGERLVSREAE